MKRLPSISYMFRSGSLKGATFNLCSATLGAGCLALPKAISQSGLVLGILFLLIGFGATIFSIYSLLRAHKSTKCGSYEALSKNLYGPYFEYFVEISIILFCFGTCISYMIAIGDIMQPITDMLHEWNKFFNRTTVTIIFTVVLMLPLSSMAKVSNLRYTSLFGVIMILYLILLTTYYSLTHSFIPHFKEVKYFNFDINMWKSLPVMMFAYTSQVNLFEIENEIERTSEKRMRKVTIRSLVVCILAYTLCGGFGYIAFGEDTQGNILKNLPISKDDSIGIRIALIIAYVGMALAVIMAYPLNIFPMRYSILSMMIGNTKLEQKYRDMSWKFRIVHYSLSFLLVALSVVIALCVQELDLIFEVTGGTTSSIIAFIAPGLYIIRIYNRKIEGVSKTHYICAYIMVIAGTIIGIWSTFVSVYWR